MAVQARYFINGHRYSSGEGIRIRGDREIEVCEIDYDDQVIINIQAPIAPPTDSGAEIVSVTISKDQESDCQIDYGDQVITNIQAPITPLADITQLIP
ncbi:unnamed protein product [Bursaphelenchus xylophilus]|uniref:(pine wood nematode) hypothetical protein n=1 Tax=Bursaphelenchus xylophilus TaxID=6326 RepID=A0A1I7SEX6_BURXY|nr:unnamed protein product [Bursaphelenchus xylophilus]CAG9113735.1 unnamed protein product [Bursaphelenchus xylophilus]